MHIPEYDLVSASYNLVLDWDRERQNKESICASMKHTYNKIKPSDRCAHHYSDSPVAVQGGTRLTWTQSKWVK